MDGLHLHMLPEIQLAITMPFKNRFFAAPQERKIFIEVIIGREMCECA